MTDTVATLMDDLCAERGGRSALSITQIALVRLLAITLSAPADSTTATTVARLLELLPPKVSDAEAPALTVRFIEERKPDLSKLTDGQINALQALMAIARGEAPQKIKRARTARQIEALRLAGLLDDAETAGDLDKDALNQVRGSIGSLLFPLATLARLVPPEVFATPSPAPQPTTIEPPPEPEPVPLPENVVPLRGEAMPLWAAVAELNAQDRAPLPATSGSTPCDEGKDHGH